MPHQAVIESTPQFNRVPKVTVDFWLIKLMAVTMGETAADYLAKSMGFGLVGTTAFMSAVLAIALYFQFAQKRYVPATYWAAVVLISIVGTLFTDCLIDTFNVRLLVTTIVFTIILGLTFMMWSNSEGTLSIHSIFTRRREIFYWVAILFTFSLGTAAGDLVAEKFGVGYLFTGMLFAAIVGSFAVGYRVFKLNAILMFWLAYIFTRPLGASFGDLLSQPLEYGGLGLGTVVTSVIFLTCISALVVYMTMNYQRDEQVLT